MEPITMGLLGAGIGGLKSLLIDGPRESSQRKVRAEQIRMSPWTGRAPSQEVEESNLFGSALQGGMTGLSLGQGIESKGVQDALSGKYGNLLDAQAKALGGAPVPAAGPAAVSPAAPISPAAPGKTSVFADPYGPIYRPTLPAKNDTFTLAQNTLYGNPWMRG